MAEFCEVMKQWRRFCKSHRHCGECEFDGKGICGDGHLSDVPANDIELRIMSWAAEHQVVYPTWENWLTTMGVQSFNELSKPIPADIAQKLGIEPKEEA